MSSSRANSQTFDGNIPRIRMAVDNFQSSVKYTKAFIYDSKDLSLYFNLDEGWHWKGNNDNEWTDVPSRDYRWENAKKCLKLVKKLSDESHDQKYANIVLIEKGTLVREGGQRTVRRLESLMTSGCEYSKNTTTTGFEMGFKNIQKKLGKQCQLIVISSNNETLEAAKKLLIPFWPIRCNDDFVKLYDYQRDFWLLKEEEEEEEEEVLQSTSENRAIELMRFQIKYHKEKAARWTQKLIEAKARARSS